jgi:hypothetical protein
MSVELMEQLLREPILGDVAQEGFPADGKIVGIHFEPSPPSIIFTIESESFEQIDRGSLPPEMKVRFSRTVSR